MPLGLFYALQPPPSPDTPLLPQHLATITSVVSPPPSSLLPAVHPPTNGRANSRKLPKNLFLLTLLLSSGEKTSFLFPTNSLGKTVHFRIFRAADRSAPFFPSPHLFLRSSLIYYPIYSCRQKQNKNPTPFFLALASKFPFPSLHKKTKLDDEYEPTSLSPRKNRRPDERRDRQTDFPPKLDLWGITFVGGNQKFTLS